MLALHDDQGRFVCYGTHIRVPSCTSSYVATPDIQGIRSTESGVALLRPIKRSKAYGYRLYAWNEEGGYEITEAVQSPRVCTIGNGMGTIGFSHWKLASEHRATMMFAQYGDPRLNGAPVVDRSSGKLIGMYLVTSWAEETKAECVPCDLFGPEPMTGYDHRRRDVETEVRSGWGDDDEEGSVCIPRAIEINSDWVFYETFDMRTKWVTHVYPDREFICADECTYLADSFKDVVLKLERGAKELRWRTGDAFVIHEARGIGFELIGKASIRDTDESKMEDNDEEEWPCIEWDVDVVYNITNE